VSKPTPGGGLSITSPRRAGTGHGDLVSALVLALYQRGGHEVEAPPAQPGSVEYEQQLVQRMLDQEIEAAEREIAREWWEPPAA
jgi:hypothetical protein